MTIHFYIKWSSMDKITTPSRVSASAIAKHAGVTPSTAWRWLHGRNAPSPLARERLAKAGIVLVSTARAASGEAPPLAGAATEIDLITVPFSRSIGQRLRDQAAADKRPVAAHVRRLVLRALKAFDRPSGESAKS